MRLPEYVMRHFYLRQTSPAHSLPLRFLALAETTNRAQLGVERLFNSRKNGVSQIFTHGHLLVQRAGRSMPKEGRSVNIIMISQTCELAGGLNCAGNQGPNVQ